MKLNIEKQQIILVGTIDEIIDCLKEYQKKYVFVKELIDSLAVSENTSPYIN